MEYYSAIKKNKIIPFAATWVELENLILSEGSQKEKDKYHIISLISGIFLTVVILIDIVVLHSTFNLYFSNDG